MFHQNEWPKPIARKGLLVWRLNRVLALVFSKAQELTDDDRYLPLVWSYMHMFSTMQIGKLVAIKRGLDPELAALTCLFHDIYSLMTGKQTDHGPKAEVYIHSIIDEYNAEIRKELQPITDEEKQRIISAVKVHSDKTQASSDPLIELLKDVDTLDSYLHGFSQDTESKRIERGNNLLRELNIKHEIFDPFID
ncbi:MAG: HD domain-containing protein [Asgard group archaeon]|nr:HD domain-containing protein [Asgard group archaeon]